MLSLRISFKNFKTKKYKISKIKILLNNLLKEENQVLKSLSKNYKNFYNSEIIKKYKNFSNFRIIGIGGSSLGTKTIYDFLKFKIKKNFLFIDNLQVKRKIKKNEKYLNFVVSKSGNTIETIVNSNILIKKKRQKYFYN